MARSQKEYSETQNIFMGVENIEKELKMPNKFSTVVSISQNHPKSYLKTRK